MKHKKADIISVAKVASVSPSTVSRYFNHPELLKLATRKRIAAQTIHGIRSGTIGVLVPTLDNAIFAEVVQAFSDTVAANGFTILLASHGYDLQREYKILRKFLEHRVDGVVLTGLDHDEAVFQLIDSQNIPCVLIWNYAAHSRYPAIGADNELAGKMIADHIASLGHRKIGCMFPPTHGNDRALARREVVIDTLHSYGISIPEEWMLQTVYSISASKSDASRLFSQPNQPTALICGNDVLATGALYAVGIGDFKGSSEIEPALTTVRLPAKRIGQQAGEALANAIITTEGHTKDSIHCEPELIIRRSSMPMRNT
jgi:LacI family transcriptional regulator